MMIKYTILYKNGKTWSGKAAGVNKIPFPEAPKDVEIILARWEYRGYMYYNLYSWCGYEKTFMAFGGGEDTGRGGKSRKQRTPNPASKTKKQKKFDEDYREWANSRMSTCGTAGGVVSAKAYKKWLWEQKQLDQASQFKVSLFNTDITHELVVEGDNQRKIIFTDPFGNTSCVKFEKPKAVDLKVTIQLPGQIDEAISTIRLIYEKPIKTTYTFWLGAGGEVVDEQC